MAMSYQLHSLLVAELSVLAEFQQKLTSIHDQAETLGKELLATAAGATVQQFLKDEGVIENLIRYGQSSTKIVFGTYGFANGSNVVDAMRRLGKAWEENVAIKIRPAEGHRIEVFFTARTPFA